MDLINSNKNTYFSNLNTLLVTFVFFIIFCVALFIRGEGWDGDSIVNIAQFNKLIYSELYNTPDGGTTPKLMPMIIFGSFHFLFNSYSIHWPTIIISSYAFAKITQLPLAKGGGAIWFFLPFTSKTLIYAIISADNPALAIAFYILAITFYFQKKILKGFIFLLLAEFSRPGYSFLMILTLFFFIFNDSLNFKKDKTKITIILLLTFIGFFHSIYCYKLAYPNFSDYKTQGWDNFLNENKQYSEYYIKEKLKTTILHLNSFISAIFSNILLPFTSAALALICLMLSFRKLKDDINILFLQPIIYFPLFIASIILGTIPPPQLYKTYFFGYLNATDPYYFATIIPILLFGISIFLSKIILEDEKIYNLVFLKKYKKKIITFLYFFKKILIFFYLPSVAIALALILSFGNSFVLKGKYEWNPVQSNPFKSIVSTHVLSDQIANKKFIEVFRHKGEKIKVLTTCDNIAILVDSAQYVKSLSFASQNVFFNKEGSEFMNTCYDRIVKKRQDDVLLNKDQKYDFTEDYDLLYTTIDMLDFFKITSKIKIINLNFNRVLIINNF